MFKFITLLFIVFVSDSPVLSIIGGNDADIKDYQYMASFQNNGTHFCGAVLISNKWAVTSAYCTKDLPNDGLTLHINSKKILKAGTSVGVKTFYNHPNYDSKTDDFDIAILELKTAVSGVSVVQLPPVNHTLGEGTILTLLGWGSIKGGNDYSENLQELRFYVSHKETCTKKITNFSENKFCAGDENESRGSCTGDSGGPVLHYNVLVGVIPDNSNACAATNDPEVFTRVSYTVDWIQNQTGIIQ